MSKRILVAEDEKPMAKALSLKLEKNGYEVETAFDGDEAITLLSGGKFDLVLLDLMMPKVDGFAVLSWKKKNKNTVPTIVSTNLSQTEDEQRAKELGAVDYFVKSNTPLNMVVAHVQKILGTGGTEKKKTT